MNQLMHQGLRDYLSPATKTSITAPLESPRLPVGPAGALPIGIRPIPTTSQTNKKTNAAIVYARVAVNAAAFGGLNKTIAEGDVAFVEKVNHPKRKLATDDGKTIRVYTLAQINAKFEHLRLPTNSGKEIADFFSVDGVVNNLDGLDTHNEFRDHAIANTAIQGPCRLAVSAEEARRVKIGDVLYVGLHATERPQNGEEIKNVTTTYKLELFRFLSSDVTRSKTGLNIKWSCKFFPTPFNS